MEHDLHFLHYAVRLAARNLGATAENPSVGCVLVQHGQVVGTGVTALGGRPHAETQALASAGERARGATAYVLLEPCAHHGKTPPCAHALIDAGIARVFVACTDPDPRVAGRGIAILHAAGIEVVVSELPEAKKLLRGFLRRVQHGLPEVTLKIATSNDGYMVAQGTQWITAEAARQHGHMLRANHQAILTGIGTVLADNPLLTCRLRGLETRNPIRIVLDRQLRLPLASKLLKTAEMVPLWLLTTPEAVEANASHASDLRARGAVLHVTESSDLLGTLKLLASAGIHRLLVEAGPTLSAAFLQQSCADTLMHYHAPHALGQLGSGHITVPASAQAVATRALAPDTLTVYKLASCLPDS